MRKIPFDQKQEENCQIGYLGKFSDRQKKSQKSF